jgi:hypothetical protein
MTSQATIVDPQQAYPPTPVVIDRPTQDTLDFVTASAQIHRRYRDDLQDQVQRATIRLLARLKRQRRQLASGMVRQAAYQQVLLAHRRRADQELRGIHPAEQLLEDAERQDDAELYRRREQAMAVLLDDKADSYAYMAPRVLADRESACRQQTLLVDEQEQANRQLRQLRGVRGLVSQRRVRRLHAELAELDRQLTQVQGQIRHQQALLDVIQAAEANRCAWLTRHQEVLHRGAAAVIVLTNPPGSVQPDTEIDLDHPKGHDPLALPATNGAAASALVEQGARVVVAATGQG